MPLPVIALIRFVMKQFRLHFLYERCYVNKGLIERIFCITNLFIRLHLQRYAEWIKQTTKT